MADFSATIRTLQQQRQDLLDQAAAIDRAIAALTGADTGRRLPPAQPAPAADRPAPPARKKRTFVLSEEHKRKMLEGRRRAREARQAEPADSGSGAPAAGWGLGAPRLVKKEPALAGVGPTEG